MTENWREMAAELTQDRLRQDMHDLNNDMAGRDTGRIKRFVTTGQSGLETTADKDNAADFRTLTEMVLQAERDRQERIAKLYERYDDIDRALDRAIAKSEEELAAAELYRQQVYENGTRMDDGRVVFIDENTGEFYDESDQLLGDADQAKAQDRYDANDSSFQDKKAAVNAFTDKEERHQRLLDKKDQFEQRKVDFENGDLTEDEFESELNNFEADPDLQPHLEQKSAVSAKHETSSSASIAKRQDQENGITTDVNMAAAFRNAGSGQPMEQPDQNHDLQETVSPITPGMGIG